MRSVAKYVVVSLIVGLLSTSGSFPVSARSMPTSVYVSANASPVGVCVDSIESLIAQGYRPIEIAYCRAIQAAWAARNADIAKAWDQYNRALHRATGIYQASVAAGRAAGHPLDRFSSAMDRAYVAYQARVDAGVDANKAEMILTDAIRRAEVAYQAGVAAVVVASKAKETLITARAKAGSEFIQVSQQIRLQFKAINEIAHWRWFSANVTSLGIWANAKVILAAEFATTWIDALAEAITEFNNSSDIAHLHLAGDQVVLTISPTWETPGSLYLSYICAVTVRQSVAPRFVDASCVGISS